MPPFGDCQGGGFGLPGDYSSPSRFVRLAMFKNYAVKGRNEPEGVMRMFHTFSCVDVPDGILKLSSDAELYEQTLGISVICAESRTYYFSAASNRRVCAVRLPSGGAFTQPSYYDLPVETDITYLNGPE